MRGFAIVVKAAAATLAAACCATSLPEQAPASKDPPLAFVLSFHEGMAPPGGPESGPIVVAWDDGTVVFARDVSKGCKDLQTGTIDAAQLQRVRDDLAQAGFFEKLPGGGLAPDASSWRLWARQKESPSGNSYVCMWNVHRFGDWSANAGASEQQRRFARMWALSRVAVSFAYPMRYEPLASSPDVKRRYESALPRGQVPY